MGERSRRCRLAFDKFVVEWLAPGMVGFIPGLLSLEDVRPEEPQPDRHQHGWTPARSRAIEAQD